MQTKNLVRLWFNLSRAYEVALLGGFSIQVMFNLEDYPTAPEDFDMIKNFYSKVDFVADGDLVVEIAPPPYIDNHTYETIDTIHERVENAKSFLRPTHLNSGANNMLKCGYERFNLSVRELERRKRIAAVMAQLDKSNIIKAEHIAESLQCVPVLREKGLCNIMSNTINFEGLIEISRGYILKETIEEAIEYLKNKMKNN